MAGIRGKNTKPELVIRRGLHARGFRYVLHDNRLPGKPDLVFPKYRAVIFVHGCFWHGHSCHLFKLPSTRREFWRKKINRNRQVDHSAIVAVKDAGWRIATVWECSLKGKTKLDPQHAMRALADWIISNKETITIRGH
nr:very short patch repair endonuclease [Bradyrhizobium symbiodeficiens]